VKIVLDTNVHVSGLISPFGVSAEIVRMIGSPEVVLCVDARIMAEYDEVINRPRFMFDATKTKALMDCIRTTAVIHPTTPLKQHLPDEDDEPFLAVAISSKADALVTGNLKHYPAHCREGARVLTPAEFLRFYKKRRTRST
jgi:putative PIN family toxin of toxin-antitoxin system